MADEVELPFLSFEFLRELALHPLAPVMMKVGDIFIDVCGAVYDAERDSVVLTFFPEDLAEAVQRIAKSAGDGQAALAGLAEAEQVV